MAFRGEGASLCAGLLSSSEVKASLTCSSSNVHSRPLERHFLVQNRE